MYRQIAQQADQLAGRLLVALSVALVTQGALAQTTIPDTSTETEQGLTESPVPPLFKPGTADPPARVDDFPRRSPSQKVEPTQIGSFYLYPQLEAGFVYDDNVFYSSSDEKRDLAVVVSPMFWMQSQWRKHALNFYASADFMRYQDYGSEDSNDYRAGIEGRHDLSGDTNFYGGLYGAREHEDRESPDDLNGLTPTNYRQYRYYAGFFRQIDRVSVRVAGTAMQLDFDDVDFRNNSGVINTINNDDRDRWQYTGGIKLGYLLASGQEGYVQVAADNRRYKSSVDDLGLARDSDGQRVLMGLRWLTPRKMKLDGYVGYMRQDYEDIRSPTISKTAFGLALSWQSNSSSKYFLVLDRTIEETTLTQTVSSSQTLYSPGYINTYVTAGIQKPVTEKYVFKLSGTFSRAAFEVIDRQDDYKSLSVGIGYSLRPGVMIDFDLTHRELRSSQSTENFDKNVAMIKVVIPF